jgi:hypothetical protein
MMMGEDLLFREIRPGEYWPPVLPNGRFRAVPKGAQRVLEILEVTEDGLRCEGVSFSWSDIDGISISGDLACLLSAKYITGGLKFHISTCSFVDESGSSYRVLNGYPVEYCLMNRITFEQQGRVFDPVSRSG